LLDTPGLNDKETFMIIDEIDEVIEKEKLSIIGIVYIISLN
jgi:hypothetical protein